MSLIGVQGENRTMRLIIGFIAAMLSVLVFHQPMILLLSKIGLLPATAVAYNMAPLSNAPAVVATTLKGFGLTGWPILFNQLFWGGLWGALFGAIHHRIPGGLMLIKGLVFGLFILLISNWLLLPFIRGTLFGIPNQTYFANAFGAPGGGFDYMRLVPGLCIQGAFGIGVGLFYSLMRRDT
jgi:hypothetical protein